MDTLYTLYGVSVPSTMARSGRRLCFCSAIWNGEFFQAWRLQRGIGVWFGMA